MIKNIRLPSIELSIVYSGFSNQFLVADSFLLLFFTFILPCQKRFEKNSIRGFMTKKAELEGTFGSLKTEAIATRLLTGKQHEIAIASIFMDKKLEQLIEAACQYPTGSPEWRKAMHRLLIEIQRLPGIKKTSHPDYLEALNQTWLWVSRNICKEFVPRGALKPSLVNWINGYLYWRIKDLHSSEANTVSLDAPIGNAQGAASLVEQMSVTNLTHPSLDGLDGYIERLQSQRIHWITLDLEAYIEQDPHKKLRSCYPRTCPQCHCQLLSQRRYLQNPPNTFSDLAQNLNMPLIKLTNHWYGRCKPLLQEIALDLGYKPFKEL